MEKTGPLCDVKVLEMCHVMAGPTCGRMLADMGADVIKLERVPGGDDTRYMLPPAIDGEPAAFMMMNCNKRGIAIDLKNNESAKAGFNISKNLNGFDLKFDYENNLAKSNKGDYLANLSLYKIY